MAMQSTKIIHADEERHKCHFCGAVRYSSNMRKLDRCETKASYHFNNDMKCWACLRECYRAVALIFFSLKFFLSLKKKIKTEVKLNPPP